MAATAWCVPAAWPPCRVVESLRTRRPFAVRGWSAAGSFSASLASRVRRRTSRSPARAARVAVAACPSATDGPYCLRRQTTAVPRLAITTSRDGCTAAISGPGIPAERSFCRAPLAQPRGILREPGRVVARRGTQGMWVLDARTGALAALGTPRQAFVEQVAWRDPSTVLAVITTVNESVSSVLRCRRWAVAANALRSRVACPAPTSSLPAADQLGSIPQRSRVSQSSSTRSSSPSSCRVTKATASASSPGTGVVGTASAQA